MNRRRRWWRNFVALATLCSLLASGRRQKHVNLERGRLSRCIGGIRVELIWSLLIIVQEISFDRRLCFCWEGEAKHEITWEWKALCNLHYQSRSIHEGCWALKGRICTSLLGRFEGVLESLIHYSWVRWAPLNKFEMIATVFLVSNLIVAGQIL